MSRTLTELRYLDTLSRMDTGIHRIHPAVKIAVTLAFIVTAVSFGRYDISALLPLILYPVLLTVLADIPPKSILIRLLAVQPLVIGVGILNPLFDTHTAAIGAFTFSAGWFIFISIVVKSSLAVAAALLLLASTGIDRIAHGLRVFFVPRLFVLQLVLTYRYIGVLMEEVGRSLTAYSMRSFSRRGIGRSAWGSMPGHILIRSVDRAERVYSAMCLRGFDGEYHTGNVAPVRITDIVYLAAWLLFFAAARHWNLSSAAGYFLQRMLN
ncbi:MAG: cobalt ECF transporter T component CbiQ [Spirochaetota bacterium]